MRKVNGRYFFQQPVNDDIKINQNIQKFPISQRDSYTRSGVCEIIQTLKKTAANYNISKQTNNKR